MKLPSFANLARFRARRAAREQPPHGPDLDLNDILKRLDAVVREEQARNPNLTVTARILKPERER